MHLAIATLQTQSKQNVYEKFGIVAGKPDTVISDGPFCLRTPFVLAYIIADLMVFAKVITLGGKWLRDVPITHVMLPIKETFGQAFTSFLGQRGEKCLEIE
jgi:hypothetical protein